MTAAVLACRDLRLRQFRNFEELELAIPETGVALVGDNGAGKTNLLEALYYLEIFRSFRGSPDEQLVRFGADAFHIRGRLEGADGRAESIEAAFERRSHRKRVAIDGAEPDRLGDAIGRVGTVIFSPSDVRLVAGPPGERRRFLDILLSLNRPGYLAALQRYRQVLRQRNALLREGGEGSLVGAWNAGLVEAGARVVSERAAWVARYAPGFTRRYEWIAGGASAGIQYRSSVWVDADPPEPPKAAERFDAELARTASRERERGMTLAGPHRDDLLIYGEGPRGPVPLTDYGSGGQQRTAAIVLRMVEAETVRERRGREPLVLLDDIFAELDPGRSRRILELLEQEQRGQVILTAPKASDLELRAGTLPHWRIEQGRVIA